MNKDFLQHFWLIFFSGTIIFFRWDWLREMVRVGRDIIRGPGEKVNKISDFRFLPAVSFMIQPSINM